MKFLAFNRARSFKTCCKSHSVMATTLEQLDWTIPFPTLLHRHYAFSLSHTATHRSIPPMAYKRRPTCLAWSSRSGVHARSSPLAIQVWKASLHFQGPKNLKPPPDKAFGGGSRFYCTLFGKIKHPNPRPRYEDEKVKENFKISSRENGALTSSEDIWTHIWTHICSSFRSFVQSCNAWC